MHDPDGTGEKPRVVAIDGPSGSGKSTVARQVADRLGLKVLDTGAMYRAVTLAVLERGISLDDEIACTRVASDACVDVGPIVLLEGMDVSAQIRGPEVTAAVSVVAAHPEVRRVLVDRQRRWVDENDGGVLEGRDIGTVVFPNATVKVFLTASDHERAERRHRDEILQGRMGADTDAVRAALVRRDDLDSKRPFSPLRAATDAVIIDTTSCTVSEVVEEIVHRVRDAQERS